MPHWLDKIIDILEAKTGNLRDLAVIAGEDPKYFYADADMSGADIRGQDLRGMQFSRLQLSNVIFDEMTILDESRIVNQKEEIVSLIMRNLKIISAMRRQEERMVALIRLYVDNPGFEVFIDDNYKEKRKFALHSLRRFRDGPYSKDLFGERLNVRGLSSFFDSIYSEAYPAHRENLLIYLPKYFYDSKGIIDLVSRRISGYFMDAQKRKEADRLAERYFKVRGSKVGFYRYDFSLGLLV